MAADARNPNDETPVHFAASRNSLMRGGASDGYFEARPALDVGEDISVSIERIYNRIDEYSPRARFEVAASG